MTAYYFTHATQAPVKITNMFDVNGDETNDPDEAVNIVAQLPDGRWLASSCHRRDIIEARPS